MSTSSPTTPILLAPGSPGISVLFLKREHIQPEMSKLNFPEGNPHRLTLPFLFVLFFLVGIYEGEGHTFRCHIAVIIQSITLREERSKPICCAETLNTLPQQGVCVLSASSIIAPEVKTGERPTTVKPPPHSCKLLITR